MGTGAGRGVWPLMRKGDIVPFAIIVLAILAFLVLINRSRSPADIGLFDDPTCVLACWQGLRPGQSTLSDIEAFYSMNFDRFSSRNFHRFGTHINSVEERTMFSAIHNSRDYNIMAFFEGDRLVNIFLIANRFPGFDLQISTILETLGSPEYEFASYEMAHVTPTVYPYINLYYPEAGYMFRADLEVRSRSDDDIEVCVQADTNISRIHIVDPGPISDLIIPYYMSTEMSSERVEALVNDLGQWEGYRCYSFPYRWLR